MYLFVHYFRSLGKQLIVYYFIFNNTFIELHILNFFPDTSVLAFIILFHRFNQTFLIVTHNEELAQMSDRILHMRMGRLSESLV